MKKKLIVVVILAICLGVGGFLLMKEGEDAATIALQKKDGIITADQVNVSFQQVGGQVTKVLVGEEQQVKKGDILITLDPTDIDLQIDKLKSEIKAMDIKTQQAENALGEEDVVKQQLAVEAAGKSLAVAQKNYDRTQQLYNNEAVSKVSLDDAETQLTLAQNKLNQEQESLVKFKKSTANKVKDIELLKQQKESLSIQLKTLTIQRERLNLKAPADGKITRVIPKVGENVASGATAVLLELDNLYFDIYMSETQLTLFSVGKEIPVHVMSLNKDVMGKVDFITVAPQFASLRKTAEKGQSDLNLFQIRVLLDKSESVLPGMTAEVKTGESTAK